MIMFELETDLIHQPSNLETVLIERGKKFHWVPINLFKVFGEVISDFKVHN